MTIAFAFAGLHTLEEMTADYFAPFFASILPVRVGFLDRRATHQTPTQIAQTLNLDRTSTQQALNTLKRHDVAHHCNDDCWEISIEFFRRWIIRQEPRNT